MIILATVAINALFGSNGLITRAQQAKEMAEIAQVQEQMELAKMEAYLDGNGKITADSYFDQLEEAGVIVDKETDVVDNGDGTYEVTTEGGEIFEVTITEDGDIEIDYIGKGENIGPRIREIKITNKTTNSVTVEVDARNAEDADYTYTYKKVGESEWKEAGASKNNTCTIENLEAQASYTIKVKVETKNGVAEKEISTTIGELPEGTITFGEVEWVGDGTASVAINTSETSYQLQYQKNGIEGQWTTIGSGEKITGLVHNDTVYGRLFDGVNETKDEASVSIQDGTDPVVTVSPGGTTTNSITVSVSAVDNESGMKDNPTYNYYIKKTSEDDSSYALKGNTLTETSYTFTGLTQETSYDVKVEVVGDKAGRKGTGTLANQTTTKVGGATGDLTTGNIVASTPTWSGGTASITLTTTTGMQIQYQVNGITEGSWTTVSTGATVNGLHHNDTVYARLYDGTNTGDYGSVSIIDNIAPTVSNITVGTITETSIQVTVTASDGQSGLAESETYTYYLENEQKASNTTSSYTYTGLTANTSYTLKVVVKDNAGKTTEKSTTIKTAAKLASEVLKEGDYVNYIDGKGITRKCVVLYDSNTSYGIDLITMDIVESVTVGKNDPTVTGDTDIDRTINSYNGLIEMLNAKSNAYNNSEYSDRARCVGTIPDDPDYDGASMYTREDEWFSDYNGKLKGEDENYKIDYEQMQKLGILVIPNKFYWVSGRNESSESTRSYFLIRYVHPDGHLNTASMCSFGRNGVDIMGTSGEVSGLRPIFHLKSEIKVIGGSGKEEEPYILGT